MINKQNFKEDIHAFAQSEQGTFKLSDKNQVYFTGDENKMWSFYSHITKQKQEQNKCVEEKQIEQYTAMNIYGLSLYVNLLFFIFHFAYC